MIEEILKNYNIKGKLIDVSQNTDGNINKTYVVTYDQDGIIKRYIIQKINTKVFTEPYKLMKNIDGIVTHLKRNLIKENDKEHQVLEVITTNQNKSLCALTNETGTKEYYRMYEYIEDAVTYNCSTDPNIVYNTGKAFGHFQRLLADYPIQKLEETIKDFHNTPKRYEQFIKDVKIDSQERVYSVAPEIVFMLMREDILGEITDNLNNGNIPYRVTHNDTKVNNVMINKNTGDYKAVIDLDTVMPGSLLFDYGDGVRSIASTAKEDEKDLTKVEINLDLFKQFTDGFLSEMAPYIKEEEVALMAESIRLITLELAIRFLNDYINGDTYFKTNYETHNLDRARNQIKLVNDIEYKLEYMNNYIYESYYKFKAEYSYNKILKR